MKRYQLRASRRWRIVTCGITIRKIGIQCSKIGFITFVVKGQSCSACVSAMHSFRLNSMSDVVGGSITFRQVAVQFAFWFL